MTLVPTSPLGSTSAWQPSAPGDGPPWSHALSGRERAELEEALDSVKRRGRGEPWRVTRADFPLPTLAARLRRIRAEAEDGGGFVLLKGLPFDGHDLADCEMLACGLGAHFGALISQNANGDLVGHVVDQGGRQADPSVRGYTTAERQRFHTDYSDITLLACRHPARAGGASLIADVVKVHDEILRRRPDLLRELYAPFYSDHRNEEREGVKPYYALPIFSIQNGRLITRYSRAYIESAQRFPDVPRLTPVQIEALDLLDMLSGSPEYSIEMYLEAGDVQIFSNYTILHSRSAYEDFPDPALKRHVLRLWVNFPDRAPLPVVDTPIGAIDIGMLRRGVPPKYAASTQ